MNLKNQQFFYGLGRKRLGIALLALLVIVFSWSSFIDIKAVKYIDGAVVKAMGAYGGARLLNGTVSVLQEIEVGVVAVTAHPLQFLDPINDLVEDYASVMKFAIGSLVVQKIVLEITSTALFKWLVTFFGVALAVSVFFKRSRLSEFVFRCFLLIGLVRFVFVISITLNGIVSQAFITDKIDKDTAKINQLSSLAGSMESSLSEDRRDEIQVKLKELEEEHKGIIEEIKVAEVELQKSKKNVGEAEARVKKLKDKMDTLDKINVFADNPEYNDAKSYLESFDGELNGSIANLESLQETRDAIRLNVEKLQKELEGDEDGFISGFKAKFSSMAVLDNVEIWKERLNGIVPETLNLMALFFFETLIIPIFTLLVLLKGFKAIWGFDVRVLAKREINDARGYKE